MAADALSVIRIVRGRSASGAPAWRLLHHCILDAVAWVHSFGGVADVAVFGRNGCTDAQLVVEVRIGDRGPVVQDDRPCSVELRV